MTNTKMLFILLPLLAMACSLTAQNAARDAMPLPEQTTTASPTRTPAPRVCQVKTGIDAGALNLRTCGGTDCPVVSLLHEGETLTQTEAHAVNGWLAIRTANGLTGWVNSNYIDCPAQNAGLK